MKLDGGLKLSLAGAGGRDRRTRFARVSVTALDATDEVDLVTDARGRMRYPLAPGAYRLGVEAGGGAEFSVSDGRWTVVRVQLP